MSLNVTWAVRGDFLPYLVPMASVMWREAGGLR